MTTVITTQILSDKVQNPLAVNDNQPTDQTDKYLPVIDRWYILACV